jgi:hypothetical protein
MADPSVVPRVLFGLLFWMANPTRSGNHIQLVFVPRPGDKMGIAQAAFAD